jgi:hypothetical protein
MSQFKNFLDKAKKKAEQFAEEIAIKPTEKKLIEYNETFFSFKVEGGPKHTDMLVAAAKIKEGISQFCILFLKDNTKIATFL